MVHKQSDAVSPKVADVLYHPVMPQEDHHHQPGDSFRQQGPDDSHPHSHNSPPSQGYQPPRRSRENPLSSFQSPLDYQEQGLPARARQEHLHQQHELEQQFQHLMTTRSSQSSSESSFSGSRQQQREQASSPPSPSNAGSTSPGYQPQEEAPRGQDPDQEQPLDLPRASTPVDEPQPSGGEERPGNTQRSSSSSHLQQSQAEDPHDPTAQDTQRAPRDGGVPLESPNKPESSSGSSPDRGHRAERGPGQEGEVARVQDTREGCPRRVRWSLPVEWGSSRS
ncbi:uncharacterized protein LOC143276874 [Babylonia areolata]|uniref:uncharacterized protein LOC143276874 n=1 Tax=Babylonia areolata TaxID=304850 RepID=UPI003FD02F98